MPSATYLWTRILMYIEQKHTSTMVKAWFDDVDVVELRGDVLVLYTPTQYRKDMIEKHCIPYITEAMLAVGQQRIQVEILNEEGLREFQSRGAAQGEDDLDAIWRDFTFENFVVGSSNQFAHAAAQAVADRPADVYNPLLIYGDSGLGKTHLLYAIANVIKARHPDYHIVYVKSDQFTNELINAIGNGTNEEFRAKYRTADLFLMDDIQFIAGKVQTQEEFFHTFNTLYEGKKQIVLTSDRPPDAMSKLENRLKTRFQWGLLADIQPPDYETRVAIIQKKADNIGLILPDNVTTYIAENLSNNVRQLEGAVTKIQAYRDIHHMEINVTNVSRAIKDMFREERNALPTPQLIITEVSSYYNVTESMVLGTSRSKNITEARQVSMYLIRTLTNLSYEDIGEIFGKDHTTVMHSFDKIDGKLKTTEQLQTTVSEITANINGRLG